MQQVESIADYLGASQQDVAFIYDETTLYHASSPFRHDFAPRSVVIDLIQGIYQNFPDEARKIVRQRIYTSVPSLTPMCFGMVKVAAKRVTHGIRPLTHPEPYKVPAFASQVSLNDWDQALDERKFFGKINPLEHWAEPHPPRTHEDFMQLTFRIAASRTGQANKKLYLRDRAIAALLVHQDPSTGRDQILGASLNTQTTNQTLHAEVNLVQNYYRSTGLGLPTNSRIYTTLKPCRMCASMIWHCTTDKSSTQIFYGEDDPGPHARDGILAQIPLKIVFLKIRKQE